MFYHEGWLNSGSQGSLDDWVQCTDTRSLVRINRGASQWTGGGNYSPSGVAINNAGSGGCCNSSERSNWATAFVAVYDRTLSSSEYQQIVIYVYITYQAYLMLLNLLSLYENNFLRDKVKFHNYIVTRNMATYLVTLTAIMQIAFLFNPYLINFS